MIMMIHSSCFADTDLFFEIPQLPAGACADLEKWEGQIIATLLQGETRLQAATPEVSDQW